MAGDAPLGELVRVRQVRRKRDYAADGTIVELSVDDVEVVMGDRVIERFAELEVELREGDETRAGAARGPAGRGRGAGPGRDTSKLERAMEAVRRVQAGEPADGDAGDDDDASDGPGDRAGVPVMAADVVTAPDPSRGPVRPLIPPRSP